MIDAYSLGLGRAQARPADPLFLPDRNPAAIDLAAHHTRRDASRDHLVLAALGHTADDALPGIVARGLLVSRWDNRAAASGACVDRLGPLQIE
jgi:hypothetical protein